ncbi:MAG: ferredoxin-thioredoxin reductase catalytic domain-containing protein [Candidatus Verstraetearchaeota archaeon]|nr:ferredoxin-thioredoxin reductase catalytic domain-containing protein [Candidatus Verstraetearchaeota archaeon]
MTTLDEARRRAESDAKSRGYFLNPDESFLKDLLEGLVENERRYGYPSCPCRIATGEFGLDRDIICPCDYRDADVEEYGACYCALYVRGDVFEKKTPLRPVPERRPMKKQTAAVSYAAGALATESGMGEEKAGIKKIEKGKEAEGGEPGMKLWYCKQCGYVAFREEPPYICPICKAKKEMFAEVKLELVG